jgi:peptide/nickel transport system substrate-binding protein
MKNAWLYRVLAVVIVGLLLLGACGPQAKPKSVTFIWTQEFDSLNPLYTNMWFSSITQQIWNCWAWDFDDQLNPHPVLLKEMPTLDNGGISADGKTITLKLRDDIVWSDGTPITSADFVFTHQMTISPKNAVATTYPHDQLDSLEAPDERTVVMKFKDPFAPWQGTFWHGIIPAHILQPIYQAEGTIDNAKWNREPTVGCGPYVFKEWQTGSFATFEANDKYWLGKPKIDEIVIRFVPDDAAQVAALKAGDGELGTFISYADIPDLEKSGVQMLTAFSGYNEGLYFYVGPKGHPALKDVNVRKAIALGFDRESLCKDLLLGLTKPAATYWDNTPWVDPSITPWPYDPEQAKALLDQAGWTDTDGDGIRDKDGVKLELKYGTTTREIRKSTQAVFQQQMQAIGIKVNLLNYDSDLYFSGYQQGGPAARGDLDIYEYSTSSNFPDPDTSEWLCDQIPSDQSPEGTNWMANCDSELDALFRQQQTQVDFAQRQATFWKITKLIFDKVYFLGYWQDPDIWAVGSQLLNAKISGATPFFGIKDWDLKQ